MSLHALAVIGIPQLDYGFDGFEFVLSCNVISGLTTEKSRNE